MGGVSVPFRGFRGLQVERRADSTAQSGGAFQSPSGVSGVCRIQEGPIEKYMLGRFSPLPGFQGSAGGCEACLAACEAEDVSVPFRGFRVIATYEGTSSPASFSPLPGFQGSAGLIELTAEHLIA